MTAKHSTYTMSETTSKHLYRINRISASGIVRCVYTEDKQLYLEYLTGKKIQYKLKAEYRRIKNEEQA